jgi:hypothetical protein
MIRPCIAWMLLFTMVLNMAACSHVGTPTFREVRCEPPVVVAWVPLVGYSHRTVGVVKFVAPPHAAGAVDWLTRIYIEELMREGPFSTVKPLEARVSSGEDAIRLGRTEQCDLVLMPRVVSLIESSGAMPTELQVHVELVDVATSRLLIGIGQKAASEPGQDVDLVWNIIEGQRALRAQQLAQMLASQYARLLTSAAAAAPFLGGK